jgi:hypothetical protein
MELPQLIRVRRSLDSACIADVAGAVRAELDRAFPAVRPGSSIAVAVGSRGIADIRVIVSETVRFLQSRGARPFVVPAMGSHGGATAAGQEEVLADYGITEATVGAPVRSSMEVVRVPAEGLEFPVYMDRFAWESDGVVLVNRVKPHTDYHGFPESGLLKMAVIGLGKQAQALVIHGRGVAGLKEWILPAARHVLASGRVLLGLGIVENATDRTCLLRAARAADIEEAERALLAEAVARMPRLPTGEVDVLIVDEMGKDVSGTGLDTNIIGRTRVFGQEEPGWPVIRVVVVTDLTAASHGNAVGVGLADVITRCLRDKIDAGATTENVVTSTFLERAKIPVVAQTDRQAIEIALRCSCVPAGREPRMIRIVNTLRLEELYVSRPVLQEMRGGTEPVETLGLFRDPVDTAGALIPFGS